jgi:membrane protein DedA with SNARE-associated domain
MNAATTILGVFGGMDAEFDVWLAGLGLVLTSFLVEDAAIAAGAALAADGMMSWETAFLWVAFGIALGDLLLFGLGYGARSIPWLRKRFIDNRAGDGVRERLQSSLVTAVFIARAVPGLRLVTYTTCGFLNVSFPRFAALVVLACALWTAGLFWLSSTIGHSIAGALGIPPAFAVAGVVIAVALAVPAVQFILSRRKKAS